MATIPELQSTIAANESKKVDLTNKLTAAQFDAAAAYAKLGDATTARQTAQNAWLDAGRPFLGATYTAWSESLKAQDAAQAAFDEKSGIKNSISSEIQTLISETDMLKKQLATANDPTATVKTPEATNPSATDAATASKYADSTNVTPAPGSNTYSLSTKSGALSLKPSANPPKPTPAAPTFQGGKDHRVRLKVPTSYLVGQAAGPNGTLVKSQGIIFPYTPTIGQEYTAVYNTVPVTHANYTQYFYKNSAVGTISLSAKFTVQNDYEAEVYFSVVHLLRALTKMRWGNEDNAGSPPPVCRLYAYGDAIMNNVPVAVSSFKLDLPDSVDYFTTKSLSSAPVLSTISLTLTPIYSRNEMQKFTVTDWLSNNLRSKGYL